LKIANDEEAVRLVAARCNLTPNVVSRVLRSVCMKEVAYTSVVDEESGLEPSSRIQNRTGPNRIDGAAAEGVGKDEWSGRLRELMTRALTMLPKEEAQLLAMRYGVLGFEVHTPGQLGRLWKVSAPAMGHRLVRVRNKLRMLLRENQGMLLEDVDEPDLQQLLQLALDGGGQRWKRQNPAAVAA
jgi:DNA-directed RNA polymerase sigma subunit (sigma70/sigma32)